MIDDIVARVGTVLVEALTRARSVMASHGHAADVRDSIDIAAGKATFEVVVGEVVVYRFFHFSDEKASAVVGRWPLDGLRELRLESVANEVQAIAARKAS